MNMQGAADSLSVQNGSYYIARNMLFLQWEAPVATIDIDVPDMGHIARGTVTAASKQHAFELMESIACHDGRRMCVRVFETTGGLRGFVTSHRISAVHLWREPAFAQHLLDAGQDPYFLIGCMATCLFSVRLSPKWINDQPRDNDTIVFRGHINGDVPEIPAAVDFVADLVRIQDTFHGLDAGQLLGALARFRADHAGCFGAAPPAKPWSVMRGLYSEADEALRGRERVLVRDVGRWTRLLPIPEPSCRFMSTHVAS